METNTKTETNSEEQTFFPQNSVDNLVNELFKVLKTGQDSTRLCYDGICIRGERAKEAFEYLKSQMNGDYTLIDALQEPFSIPNNGKIPVVVLDREPFDSIFGKYSETGMMSRVSEMIYYVKRDRPELKVIIIDEQSYHEGGISYTINANSLLNGGKQNGE